MKKLFVLVAAVLLIMAASCDTKNIGVDPGPIAGPVPEATFVADTTWNENETATLTVNWTGGTAPYTIGCNMGGGTTLDVPAGTGAVSPFTQVFTLVEGTWTYTVTVIDVNSIPGTVTGTFEVGEALNIDPVIDNVTVDGGTLTVEVSDADTGQTLTVTVTEPAGMTVDATSKVAAQSSGTAVFAFSAVDIVAGATGDTTITVDDGAGGEATDTATITLDPLVIGEGELKAVAGAGAAAVGGEVPITVISGAFPAGAAFNYMNGVGVMVEEGAEYVDGTLNVGAVGGEQKDSDGLWGDMSPTPGSYLLPDDFMIVETPVDGSPGMIFIGFNVTPIGGGDVSTGGPLFNFHMTFTAAGTYTLGFIEFQDVKRTYYSDATSAEFNWTDITNDGVPNTIDVT